VARSVPLVAAATPRKIFPPDHNADLDPKRVYRNHIAGDLLDNLGIDSVSLTAHQRLTGQLEQNTVVLQLRIGHGRLLQGGQTRGL